MPSTRMIPPSPNQARRKALSFLLCSLALPSSSWLIKAGFSTGNRLIIDALSLLPFCFFLLVTLLAVNLLGLGLVEAAEDDDEPNPSPGDVGFLVGAGSSVGSVSVVGFWHLIVSLGLVEERRREVWGR